MQELVSGARRLRTSEGEAVRGDAVEGSTARLGLDSGAEDEEAGLPLEWDGVAQPAAEGDSGGSGGPSSGGGDTSRRQREAAKAAVRQVHTYEFDGEEDSGSDHEWDQSEHAAPQVRRGARVRTASARSSDTPRENLDSFGGIGSLLRNPMVLGTVSLVAQDYKLYDIDAFAAEYRDAVAAGLFSETLGGNTHPIHPLGAEWAKQRGLYDDDRFAMAGLSQPEKRRGLGVLLGRNKYGYSRADVGKMVPDPEGGDGLVRLTYELVGMQCHTTMCYYVLLSAMCYYVLSQCGGRRFQA